MAAQLRDKTVRLRKRKVVKNDGDGFGWNRHFRHTILLMMGV
jgi:hypothetical protein